MNLFAAGFCAALAFVYAVDGGEPMKLTTNALLCLVNLFCFLYRCDPKLDKETTP